MNTSRLRFGTGSRLHAAAEFSAVFASRRVLRGEHFDLHFRREGAGRARFGLVIAKKFARSSVLRNTLKRIGREAFRAIRPDLPDCDLVLRLSRPVLCADRLAKRAWRTEIDLLLARVPRELSR